MSPELSKKFSAGYAKENNTRTFISGSQRYGFKQRSRILCCQNLTSISMIRTLDSRLRRFDSAKMIVNDGHRRENELMRLKVLG